MLACLVSIAHPFLQAFLCIVALPEWAPLLVWGHPEPKETLSLSSLQWEFHRAGLREALAFVIMCAGRFANFRVKNDSDASDL